MNISISLAVMQWFAIIKKKTVRQVNKLTNKTEQAIETKEVKDLTLNALLRGKLSLKDYGFLTVLV